MSTAGDMIRDALGLTRVYAPGDVVTGADMALGLRVLNRMMDSWSNEALACFARMEQSSPLVVQKATYTIGPGGDFDMARPLKLLSGDGAAYLQDALGNNFPITVVEQDQWNLIGNRTTTSDIPDTLFYDAQFPLGTINIFPTPTNTYTLFWDSTLQLEEFADQTTPVTLPPGYEAAIVHNLAIWLKPYFKAADIAKEVVELARTTLAAIKRTNIREVVAGYDTEIVAKGSSTYNIYRDGRGSNG